MAPCRFDLPEAPDYEDILWLCGEYMSCLGVLQRRFHTPETQPKSRDLLKGMSDSLEKERLEQARRIGQKGDGGDIHSTQPGECGESSRVLKKRSGEPLDASRQVKKANLDWLLEDWPDTEDDVQTLIEDRDVNICNDGNDQDVKLHEMPQAG